MRQIRICCKLQSLHTNILLLGLDLSADKLLWSHPNCQIISLLHLQIYSIFQGYILIVGVTLPLTRVLCNSRYRSAEFELHAIKFCGKRIFWLVESAHFSLAYWFSTFLVGWPCSGLLGGGASIFFPSWPQQIPLDFARSCWKIKQPQKINFIWSKFSHCSWFAAVSFHLCKADWQSKR